MNDINLKVVGCGDAFGSGGSLNTCFYIDAGSTGFLMDCGATSLSALKRQGIEVDHIDAILISHFHGDHYGGVPFILLEAAIYKRTKKIQIISPPGGKERISALLDLLYPGTPVLEKLDIEFLEYAAGQVLYTKHFSVQAFPVVHSEDALPHGLRVEIFGRLIAYSGDTSWTDTLLPLSAQADVFICECNFFSTQAKGHINYLELEKHLSEVTAKKIFLTHFDQEMLNSLDSLKVEYLTDGKQLKF